MKSGRQAPVAAATDWMAPLFRGKTFAVKGRFSYRARADIPSLIRAEGGAIRADVTARLDILVAGAVGAKGAVEQAKRLNQKGRSIQILGADDFFELVTPSPADAVSLLRQGKKGARRWNALRDYGDQRPLRLRAAQLRGAKLPGLWFSSVTLDGGDLRDADLTGSYLQECRGVQFQGACLIRASLGWKTSRCNFDHANLKHASINGFADSSCIEADLTDAGHGAFAIQGTRADFTRAKLVRFRGGDDSNFTRATFIGADLTEAKLPRSKWQRADCTGATFSRADLHGSDLRHAVLKNANLQGANLACASLVKADLTGADLRGASFIEADLSHAIIDGADFEGAHLAGACLRALDAAKAKSLDPRRAEPGGSAGAQLDRLDQLLRQMARRVKVSAVIDLPDGQVRIEATGNGGNHPWFHVYAYRGSTSEYLVHAQSFREIMYDKTRSYAHGKLAVDSIVIETRSSPISRAELKALTIAAWSEAFGVTSSAP